MNLRGQSADDELVNLGLIPIAVADLIAVIRRLAGSLGSAWSSCAHRRNSAGLLRPVIDSRKGVSMVLRSLPSLSRAKLEARKPGFAILYV